MRRTWLLVVLAAVVAFAAGYVPKDIEAGRLERDLGSTTLDLQFATALRQLGVASHQAQRNDYPAAEAAARAFFDSCRALSEHDSLGNEPRTRIALNAYTSYAPAILDALASGDPAVKEQLASLYLTMNGVLERRPRKG